MKILITSLLTLYFMTSAFACVGGVGILPKNNLRIPVSEIKGNALTKEQFENLIKKFKTFYSPVFNSRGGTLTFDIDWENDEVNAYADREESSWQVILYGGMARHPEMTLDGYTLVVCHEMGHHVGGAPLHGYIEWASAEAQSDYFATTKCLRHMFLKDDNAAIAAQLKAPPKVVKECSTSWANKPDRDICIRSAMAGMAFARVIRDVYEEARIPSFTTPSRKMVSVTETSYPPTQCRLDTYFQGSLCTIDKAVEMTADEKVGACIQGIHAQGFRPRCWYAPEN